MYVCVCICGRYLEAVQPVEDGLSLVERGLVPTDCYWPGTETVIQDVASTHALKVSCYYDLQCNDQHPCLLRLM